jgi:sugar phosphate isomerase/epimerase
MRIGISRFSKTPEQAYEVLATARRYGFAGVQMKPTQYQEFIASPEAFAQRYSTLADLTCGGLIAYPGGDPQRWMTEVEPILPFAAAINAEHICLCSGVYNTNATDEQVQDVAEALTAIGQRAQAQNLAISIHNHVDSIVESEADIARLLERVEPKWCGLTLDTAHAAKAGITHVERLIPRFQQHLINVHLKDLATDGRFCALGTGTLEIPPILDALNAINYQQWLIVDEETGDSSTAETFAIAHRYLAQAGLLESLETR